MSTKHLKVLYDKHLIPLESDPDMFMELMNDLGVTWIIDVWSLEDDMLAIME